MSSSSSSSNRSPVPRTPTLIVRDKRKYRLPSKDEMNRLKFLVCKTFTDIVDKTICGMGVVLMISPHGASTYTTVESKVIKTVLDTTFFSSLRQSSEIVEESIPGVAVCVMKPLNDDNIIISDDDNKEEDGSNNINEEEGEEAPSITLKESDENKDDDDGDITIIADTLPSFRAHMETDIYSIPELNDMHWCFLSFKEETLVYASHTSGFPLSALLLQVTVTSIYTSWKEIHRLNFNVGRKTKCKRY